MMVHGIGLRRNYYRAHIYAFAYLEIRIILAVTSTRERAAYETRCDMRNVIRDRAIRGGDEYTYIQGCTEFRLQDYSRYVLKMSLCMNLLWSMS